MSTGRFTVGVALDGDGWHPAAAPASAGAPTAPPPLSTWRTLVTALEAAGTDHVTFEDTFSGWGPPGNPDLGRLDATVLAAALAGSTHTIGLIPVITVTHTEPYHVATRVATLDFAAQGRAGWQVRISARPDEAALTNLSRDRDVPSAITGASLTDPFVLDAFDEAAAVVATSRDLWDSWDDDAVIRDVATGRFLDADRLHHVDAVTPWFSVAGPSIVPRPPSGQPLVAVLAHATVPYRLAATSADVVFVTPTSAVGLAEQIAEIRALEAEVGRTGEPLRIVADLLVAIGPDAAERRAALDADVVAGEVSAVVDRIADLAAQGADGVRLRPLQHDPEAHAIAVDLLPALRERGLVTPRDDGGAGGLRGAFGLGRPTSRCARARETAR